MTRWSTGLLALLFFSTALRGQADGATAGDLLEFIPAVVADYGQGEQLRGDEVRPLVAPQVQAMLAQGQRPTPEQLRAWTYAVAEGMINQRLALAEALKGGATLDLEAGQRQVAEQEERLGKKAFARALKLQGLSADALARHLAENAAVQGWMAAALERAGLPTEADAKAAYDGHPEQFRVPARYHASHLLLVVPAAASPEAVDEARQRLQALRDEVSEGRSFAALAAAHSACPSRALGGDLGLQAVGRMPPAFDEVAQALEPGQISDPVRTPLGWHLIRGGVVLPAVPVPFERVRDDLLQALRIEAAATARQGLFRELREQARVRLYLEAP